MEKITLRIAVLNALCIAGLGTLPGLALAADSNPALKALFDQAAYWHDKAHDELAKDALQKILMVDANNPEALYLMSLYSMQGGDKAEAAQWRQKLSETSPQDPRLQDLESAKMIQAMPPGQLASARQLASQGNTARALQSYQALFNGTEPPDSLAVEYYLTMAGDKASLPQAIQGLQQRVAEHPNDNASRLALGKVLTYQDSSRRDGISLLGTMADKNTEADRSLRQALLWLNPQPTDAPLYQAYQQRHPNDTAVMAYFQKNVGGAAKGQGFTALNSGDIADARNKFESVLATNPQDADALAGLGYIAERGGDFAAAQDYLNRAAALGGPNSAQWRTQAQEANFYAELAKAKSAATSGNLDSALALSAPLAQAGGDKAVAVNLFRADVLRRKGDLAGSEQLYRSIVNQDSQNNDAKTGLYYVLRQQNKNQDAEQVLATIPANLRPRAQPAGVNVDPLRREAALAMQNNDPQRAINLLQQAIDKQPTNIWARLDMARILEKQGNNAQAQALMAPATQRGAPAGDLYAAALFASESKNWGTTRELLSHIPANSQTSEMRALATRANFNQQMAVAENYIQRGDSAAAANTLQALAQNPPDSPADVGNLAKNLQAVGDTPTAVRLVRQNMQQGVKGNAGDYAAQLSVLNQAGLASEADAWLRNPAIQASSSAVQISQLRTGSVINEADQLRNQGQYAAAYDKLIVALQSDPQNRDLMLAMARLYQSGKMNAEAGKVYDYLMTRDTPTQDAREGAINIALAQGDVARARQLMGGFTGPRTPQRLLLAARVAEAEGDHDQALALLRSAKGRLIGLDGTDGVGTPTIAGLQLSDNPFINQTTAARRPATQSVYGAVMPWQQNDSTLASSSALSGGRVAAPVSQQAATLKQVDEMLDELQDKTATWVQGDLSIRGRDGESGLSQLTEAKAPLTFSTVPFETSRLSLSVTPVSLSAGSSSNSGNTRFGQGALQQGTAVQNTVNTALTDLLNSGAISATDFANAKSMTLAKLQSEALRLYTVGECGSSTNANNADCQSASTIIGTNKDDYTADSSGSQNASGVEVNLGLAGDHYKADIGTTPLGQDLSSLVGGVQWSPQIGSYTTLTLTGERRPITDSLLSYVGTTDKYSGNKWGAVTKNGGSINLAYDNGDAGFYTGVGYYSYLGDNVASNKGLNSSSGVYVRPFRYDDRELKTGINVTYMDFSKNLSYFSYGQGGYFSPQNYVSVSLPVEYTQKYDDWDLKLSAAVGYQSYTQDETPYFPGNSGLQSQLEDLVKNGYATDSSYAAKSESGIGYNFGAQGTYKINRNMLVGGRLGYDTFGDYSESTAGVYFRYLLDGK